MKSQLFVLTTMLLLNTAIAEAASVRTRVETDTSTIQISATSEGDCLMKTLDTKNRLKQANKVILQETECLEKELSGKSEWISSIDILKY